MKMGRFISHLFFDVMRCPPETVICAAKDGPVPILKDHWMSIQHHHVLFTYG